MTGDYGDPSRRSTFTLINTQTKYEFRIDKKKTYVIEKVYILDSNNNRVEYTAGTASETNKEFTQDLDFNSITFHSSTISNYDGLRVIIDYIPNAIHWMVRLKAALTILDRTNVTNAEENTPTLGLRILQRVGRLEMAFNTEMAVGSEDEINYDPTWGENVPQRRFRTY